MPWYLTCTKGRRWTSLAPFSSLNPPAVLISAGFLSHGHMKSTYILQHNQDFYIFSLKNAQLTMVPIGAELINEADHHGDYERRPEDGVPQLHGEGREEGPGVETLFARAQQDSHLQVAVGLGEGNHLLSSRADREGTHRHVSRLEIWDEHGRKWEIQNKSKWVIEQEHFPVGGVPITVPVRARLHLVTVTWLWWRCDIALKSNVCVRSCTVTYSVCDCDCDCD